MQELIAGPWGPALIFVLRLTDVSLATVRILLIHRQRSLVPVLGFVEMCIVAVGAGAVGATVSNLTSPLHIVGYAGGFAAGSWLGIRIEERMAIGLAMLRVVVREGGEEIAGFLRAGGFGVTETVGKGKDGPVHILNLVLSRKDVRRCVDLLEVEAPDAFVIMEEPRGVQQGYLTRMRR